MTRVGVLPHHSKPEAAKLADEIIGWLEAKGHEASLEPDSSDGLDLLVVLGGDGTMLHGIALAGFAGVPLLGINLGRMGFLTEAPSASALAAVESAVQGKCEIDSRCTVAAEVLRRDGTVEDLGQGINEVSMERAVGGKLIRMSMTLGGQPFTSFGADGVIIATPTGSTAYAFSMRGPVVAPDLRCLVVVAVGAHALFDRPLVVGEPCEIVVKLEERGRGVVVVDGRPACQVAAGDTLRARIGDSSVKLVRLGPDSTFTRVAQRFGFQNPD